MAKGFELVSVGKAQGEETLRVKEEALWRNAENQIHKQKLRFNTGENSKNELGRIKRINIFIIVQVKSIEHVTNPEAIKKND